MPDVRLPDGRVIKGVPEGTSRSELARRLVKGDVITREQANQWAGQKKRNRWATRARMVGQGLTFGFGDELEAALTPRTLQDVRSEIKGFREDNPLQAIGLELGGGMLTGVGLGGMLARAGGAAGRALTAPRILPQTALGGAEGAAYGAGTADDDRLGGAIVGGLAGAATGGMAAPLINALGRKLAPGQEAKKLIERAVKRDIGRAPTASDYRGMARRAKEPLTLAESGGATLEDLARTSASMPAGGAREVAERALTTRSRESADRLVDALHASTGNYKKYQQNLTALEQMAKQEAAPLYRQAYSQPVMPDEELGALMQRGIQSGDLKKGYQKAQRMLAREGRELPEWKVLEENLPTNVEIYDQLKRGLDAQYKALLRKSPDEARSLWIYRQSLVNKLDELSPSFAQARRSYAGPMAQREAQELGRNILKEDAEFSADLVSSMSQAEKDAYVVGATRALADRIKNVPLEGGQVRMTQLAIDRLRPAFDSDEAFDAFVGALTKERKMQQFKNMVLGGSPTQRIAASQEDASKVLGVGGGLAQMMAGQPITGAQTMFSALRPPVATTIPENVNRQLAGMLFSQGPDMVNAFGQMRQPGVVPSMLAPAATTGSAAAVSPFLVEQLQ